MLNNNVSLPSGESDEEYCHICLDDNVAIIIQNNVVHGCGIQSSKLALCQFCYSEIVFNADALLGRNK